MDPGIGSTFSGGSVVSPFNTSVGYFEGYVDGTGPPPIAIPGVTFSGNGFRDPCSTSMNFNQTVSWTMTSGSVTGSGTATYAIQFNP